HRGGYTPFSFEITDLLKNGNNVLTVNAVDDNRSGLQPRGKQSAGYYSAGCDYTRTTGIWQTVWLKAVPESYIKKAKYISNPKDSSVNIELEVDRKSENLQVELTALYKGTEVGNRTLSVNGNLAQGDLIVSEVHLWEPGKPELYDLEITLLYNGQQIDHVSSYFGMRTVSLRDKAIYINEKPVFQRLVLDQGFYPDGIYTAPSDEALKRDIELSMELGFNGARLHEKVFEPRFLYWADQMGYLVWGEHANWGLNITNAEGLSRFLPEWIEAVDRDFNSPALVGWCPFNETWGSFQIGKDIFDSHHYEPDAEKIAETLGAVGEGGEAHVTSPPRRCYEGQPACLRGYGGIRRQPGNDAGSGYGTRPKSKDAF